MTTISGFEELADELEEFAEGLEEMAGEPIEEAMDDAIDHTTWRAFVSTWYNAPVLDGDLRESIRIADEHSDTMERWIVVGVDYAKAIEYGRGPVTITPKNARALRFEIDGRVVYASKVEQDPRPEQPYLRPALAQHRSTLRRRIRSEYRKVLREAF